MATITKADFLDDSQGRTYTDVVNDPRVTFDDWLDFFNSPIRQQRLKDACQDHERPALAGVIKELESHPAFKDFLANEDAHTTTRSRQAIGVLVRIIMEKEGWQRTGTKGSLGTRLPVVAGTKTPGAYRNNSGLSKWFTKAENYQPKGGFPY